MNAASIKTAKASAIRWAQEALKTDFVIIDFETSGWGDDFRTEIIQIAILDRDGNTVLDELLRPVSGVVQRRATDVHGLTMDDVRDKPHFHERWADIWEMLNNKTVIAYNVEFERRNLMETIEFMRASGNESTVPRIDWQCAMLKYAEYYGEWSAYRSSWAWHKLTAACNDFGIEVEEKAHSSIGDCIRTLRLIEAMAAAQPVDEPKLTMPTAEIWATYVEKNGDGCLVMALENTPHPIIETVWREDFNPHKGHEGVYAAIGEVVTFAEKLMIDNPAIGNTAIHFWPEPRKGIRKVNDLVEIYYKTRDAAKGTRTWRMAWAKLLSKGDR